MNHKQRKQKSFFLFSCFPTVYVLGLKRYSGSFIIRDDWSKIKHLLLELLFIVPLHIPAEARLCFCSAAGESTFPPPRQLLLGPKHPHICARNEFILRLYY